MKDKIEVKFMEELVDELSAVKDHLADIRDSLADIQQFIATMQITRIEDMEN